MTRGVKKNRAMTMIRRGRRNPTDLPRLRDWAPTVVDTPGVGPRDKKDWLVLPVVQTRDSGALDRANFDAARKMLDRYGDDVEVLHYKHWGPGWVEIIVVAPVSGAATEARDIAAALEEYPVLDEDLWSEYESEEEQEAWESWGREDFRRALIDEHPEMEDEIDELEDDELDALWHSADVPVEHDESGPRFDFQRAAAEVEFAE